MSIIIQKRRDTAANFAAANRIYAQGEDLLEIDTNKEKVGDGLTAYNSLPYKSSGESGGTVKSEAFTYNGTDNIFTVSAETITTLIDVQIGHGCNFNDIATIDNDNEVTIATEGILYGGEKIRIIYI